MDTPEQTVLNEIEQTTTMQPTDARNIAFSTTRIAPGYDMDEVDQLLDQIETGLAVDLAALHGLHPSAVEAAAFTTTVLRAGYAQSEVDEFLERVRAELARRWEIAARHLGATWNGPPASS